MVQAVYAMVPVMYSADPRDGRISPQFSFLLYLISVLSVRGGGTDADCSKVLRNSTSTSELILASPRLCSSYDSDHAHVEQRARQ